MLYQITILLLFFIIISAIIFDYLKNTRNLKNTMKCEDDLDLDLDKIKFEKNIPRIIYRTHYDKNIMNKFSKEINLTEKNTPNFEYKFYNNEDIENFILKNFHQRIYKAYMSIKDKYGACKADFFRYLVVFKYGGIYLDIKSVVIKEIESILKKYPDKLIVNYPNNLPLLNSFTSKFFPYGEFNQWCIVSPKGHPVLKKIIEEITHNIELENKRDEKIFKGGYGVLSLTGPVIFTKIIKENINENIEIIGKDFDKCFQKYLSKNYNSKYGNKNMYWNYDDNIII